MKPRSMSISNFVLSTFYGKGSKKAPGHSFKGDVPHPRDLSSVGKRAMFYIPQREWTRDYWNSLIVIVRCVTIHKVVV